MLFNVFNSPYRLFMRLFGIGKGKSAPMPETQSMPHEQSIFVVGKRYYDEKKNRVFECIAMKGKKTRFVAFSCIDSVEEYQVFLKEHPEFGGFNKVCLNGSVETCQRGALRADRQATEKEVAEELDFLRRLHKKDFPEAGVVVGYMIGIDSHRSSFA